MSHGEIFHMNIEDLPYKDEDILKLRFNKNGALISLQNYLNGLIGT
jgi:hypothetical protein